MKRAWLAVMILLLGGLLAPDRHAAGVQEALDLADLAFVSTGCCSPAIEVNCDGCDAPSVLAFNRDEPVWRGKDGGAMFQLAASSDFSRLLGVGTYTSIWQSTRYERIRTNLYLARRTSDDWWHWESQVRIFSDDVCSVGAIAFLADGDSFLVSTCRIEPPLLPPLGPYGVAKYRVSEIEPFESDVGWEWQLGPRRGYLRLLQEVKRIFVTADGGWRTS